jgi:transposase
MPKKIHFELTEAGWREIVEAIKGDKRPEVRQRAMGVRVLHEGKAPKEVAALLSVSQPTVYDGHHRWQAPGVEGLAHRPKSGRRVKATREYVALLEQVVDQDPQTLG